MSISNKNKVIHFVLVLLILIVGKVIWVRCASGNIGSFENEKADILRRRAYLLDKVITEPQKLIDMFPPGIGEHFQGEWAIYTCSMLSASLVNIAKFYPETKEESIAAIDFSLPLPPNIQVITSLKTVRKHNTPIIV